MDTVYQYEDMGPMTLAQMLDGVDPDLIPSDQVMYEDLLWAFGAWETLEEMKRGHGHAGVHGRPRREGVPPAGEVATRTVTTA